MNLFMNKNFSLNFYKNRDYILSHGSDRGNPFHFACHRWYKYNNPGYIYIYEH